MGLEGFRQATPMELAETMTAEVEAEAMSRQQRANLERARATAAAQMSHALGVDHREMTPAQRGFAEGMARRGGRTMSSVRQPGFSISTEGREPKVR